MKSQASETIIDEDVIQSAIERKLQELIASGKIQLENEPPAPLPAPQYKKHFRVDNVRELNIQALDMSVLDVNESPSKHPIPGKYYTFRNGHFLTSDDNAIRQIEWILENSKDGASGAVSGIYEDDGTSIYRCDSCDFITASHNAWRAHLRSQHGREVS